MKTIAVVVLVMCVYVFPQVAMAGRCGDEYCGEHEVCKFQPGGYYACEWVECKTNAHCMCDQVCVLNSCFARSTADAERMCRHRGM